MVSVTVTNKNLDDDFLATSAISLYIFIIFVFIVKPEFLYSIRQSLHSLLQVLLRRRRWLDNLFNCNSNIKFLVSLMCCDL